MNKYGVDWPEGTSPVTIELGMYRILDRSKVEERAVHLTRAMGLLWPEPVFRFSPWTHRRVRAWCQHDWITMWGASSTGKSTDVGAIVLANWLAAPFCTTSIVCSTTAAMLQKRIFGEIVRLYQCIDGAPGHYRRSDVAIVLGDENSKNGIFGVAILKGTIKEALGNLVGVHNVYNSLVIDEMQATREAAVQSVSNLQGGREFKFVGLGNPESRLDPLGRYSEPKGGWNAADPSMEQWETQRGVCLFFDGRKSPAITEPDGEKLYPYLLKKSDVEQRIKWFGENSPQVWSQTIGFVPPEGILRTLFAETFFVVHRCSDVVGSWQSDRQLVMGVDPAFSSGGDRCVATILEVGKDTEGMWRVSLVDQVLIELSARADKPIAYQVAYAVRDECEKRGISPDLLGLDTTGTQGTVADVIETEWRPGLLRVSFGGRASERMASQENASKCSDLYGNMVTELWHDIHTFCRFGHIRGLTVELMRELCSRMLTERVLPVFVEQKKVMKARTGASPDLSDSFAVALRVVRDRLGMVPGGGVDRSGDPSEGEDPVQYDVDAADDLYLTAPEDDQHAIPHVA